MIKAVQPAVQHRYEASETVPASEIVSTPWKPRTDDKRALLVTERATVFDRPARHADVDPNAEISDPLWNHREFTSWTPDLVHCRLLVTGEIITRMPPVLRRGYVSQLGNMAISEISAVDRRIPPTPQEISLADWTLLEIAARQWRSILLASAFDLSVEKIAKGLKAAGQEMGKSTVHRHYVAERRYLAGRWQAQRQPIDRSSVDRWQQIFTKTQK